MNPYDSLQAYRDPVGSAVRTISRRWPISRRWTILDTLPLDLLDRDAEEILAVTLFAAIPLAAFEFDDVDLGTLQLTANLGNDLRTLDVWLTDLAGSPIADHQDLIELERLLPIVEVMTLNLEGVAFADFILVSPVFNNRVHA